LSDHTENRVLTQINAGDDLVVQSSQSSGQLHRHGSNQGDIRASLLFGTVQNWGEDMTTIDLKRHADKLTSAWLAGVSAGLAGGAIEVAWIALYQGLAGHDSVAVARGVTQSMAPHLASTTIAASLGVAIHMGLAVLLGVAIAFFVQRFLPRIVGTAWEPVVVVGILAGVWAMNFLVILPLINPEFVTIVPLSVSFASKMLFGLVAAITFWGSSRLQQSRQ
jgi:hypothetical protein